MPSAALTILTPEHVPIELVPAGMGRRFMAWLVDVVIIFGICTILYLLSSFMGQAVGGFVSTTVIFVLSWGYHVCFEVLAQGRSPGKRMLGLRVVDDRGLPVGLQQSFVRNIVRALDMQPGAFYGVGALTCLLNRETRRMGDIAAGTLIVHETRPLQYPRQLAEGRQYNSLKQPRVLRLIRHKIGLEEREFLLSLCLRAPRLTDKARFDLMDAAGNFYREKLKIDDPHLSGENLVRGLTAILFEKKD